MRGAVTVVSPSLPSLDLREILRYAGVRDGEGESLIPLITELGSIICPRLTPGVCYLELPLKISGKKVFLGNIEISSESLAKQLSGCASAVLFAATVGISLDREILRAGTVSPIRQLVADAIGTERIEALCDSFCSSLASELSAENKKLTPRFSAGYGDLPLAFQNEIFSILDCPRKIGLTLNDSLIMSPAKSVTAIVGVMG